MNPFQSLHEYEEFVYTLPNRYPFIRASTLVVARRGAKVADLEGELMFDRVSVLAFMNSLPFTMAHSRYAVIVMVYGVVMNGSIGMIRNHIPTIQH